MASRVAVCGLYSRGVLCQCWSGCAVESWRELCEDYVTTSRTTVCRANVVLMGDG